MWKSIFILGIFDRNQSPDESIKEYLEQLWEYQEAEANLMVEIATLQYEKGDTDDAIGFLEKAVGIYHELGFAEQEATILDLIGDVYLNLEEIKTALDYYKQSYKLCVSNDLPFKEGVFNKIKECEEEGQTTGRTTDKTPGETEITTSSSEDNYSEIFDEGFSSEDGEEIDYELIGKKLDDIIGLLEESSVYASYQKFENPMAHIKEAYEMSRSIGDEKGEAALILIMGDLSLKEEKTKKSLDYFLQSLKLFQKIGDKKGEAISRLMIGTAYFLLGKTEEGSVYLRQSMEIIKNLRDEKMEKASMALLKSIYG